MEDKLVFQECYICLEETPLRSQCQCKDRFLCENCMEKLRIYKYKRCTVCNTLYPKPFREEMEDVKEYHHDMIDVHMEIPIRQRSRLTYTPCCLRSARDRHEPKYCFYDCFFHIFCIYFIMLATSCISNPEDSCYQWDMLQYAFLSVIAYMLLTILLGLLCRK